MRILDYTATASAAAAEVGAKARNLACMHLHGFRVPPGFCVIADGDGQLTAGDREAIRQAVAELGSSSSEPLYAVRSSAAVEDGRERSYAGLFVSFCDLPISEVAGAVARCRRGMRSARLGSYGPGGGGGVIVQRMVDVTVGGVLFGCDPVSGDGSRVVVEYARGPVSRVVGGEVTPERLSLAKGSLDVEPAGDAVRPALEALLSAADELETLFGAVLDIEWGWDGARLWLLQARPVTVTERPEWDRPQLLGYRRRRFIDGALWTTANASEAFPGVLSPFATSLLERIATRSADHTRRWTPIVIQGGDGVFGIVRGRVTLCLSAVLEVVSQIPRSGITADYLSRQIGAPIERLPDVPTRSRRDFLWRLVTRWWPGLLMLLRMRGTADSMSASVMGQVRRMKGLDAAGIGDRRLAALTEHLSMRLGDLFFWHTAISTASSTLTQAVDDLLERRFGAEGRGVLNRLLSDLAGLESAAPAQMLMEIADEFGEEMRASGDVLGLKWAEARVRLERSRQGRAVLRALGEFVDRYGYRGVNEVELLSPRWDEQPELIWRTLVRLVERPARVKAGSMQRWEEVLQGTAALLSLRDRLKLRVLLPMARGLIRQRENSRAAITAGAGQVRRLVLEAGRRMARRGRLDVESDVSYLEIEEVLGLLREEVGYGADMRDRVQGRRRHMRYWESLPGLPVVFTGRPGHGMIASGNESGGLTGVPVSCGRARGRARIVTDPDHVGSFGDGDILVAPYLNPGWSPLFPLAGAIVSETGGMMSHGAIIARELGIPAVVGVTGATAQIADGDELLVDANGGRVEVLSSSSQ